MSSTPPPIYVPPPYQAPKTTPVASIFVLTILGIFAFVMLLVGLAAIGSHFGRAKARNGWNLPVRGVPIKDGWSTYHLEPMNMSIASFTKPVPAQDFAARSGTSSSVSEFAQYKMENRDLQVRLSAFWMRSTWGIRSMASQLDRMGNDEQRTIERNFPSFTRSKVTVAKISGLDARLATVQFTYRGTEWVIQCAVFIRDNVIYYLEGKFWKSKSAWGERAFESMAASVKLDPLNH